MIFVHSNIWKFEQVCSTNFVAMPCKNYHMTLMPNKEFLPKEIIFESVLLILKFQISFLAELKFEQL